MAYDMVREPGWRFGEKERVGGGSPQVHER